VSRKPARSATERLPSGDGQAPGAREVRSISSDAFDDAPAMLRAGDVSGVASLLQLAANANPVFGRAARALLGSGPGRRALDDDAALAEMARALAAGEEKFVAAAARHAAAKLPGRHSLDSAADRLERKFRKKRGNIKSRDRGRDSA
jgi:hypothetical protein